MLYFSLLLESEIRRLLGFRRCLLQIRFFTLIWAFPVNGWSSRTLSLQKLLIFSQLVLSCYKFIFLIVKIIALLSILLKIVINVSAIFAFLLVVLWKNNWFNDGIVNALVQFYLRNWGDIGIKYLLAKRVFRGGLHCESSCWLHFVFNVILWQFHSRVPKRVLLILKIRVHFWLVELDALDLEFLLLSHFFPVLRICNWLLSFLDLFIVLLYDIL